MTQPTATVGFHVGAAAELGVAPDAIAQFYESNWNRRIALGIPSFYRWQFIDPPGSCGEDHCCVALNDNGAILGVMGAHPRAFQLAGTLRNGAEMTTWVVAEQARGRGVGRRIMESLQGRFDVLLGAGISTAAIPLYMMAGFRFIRHLPRYVRIYSDPPTELMRVTEFGRRLLQRPVPSGMAILSASRVAAYEVAGIAHASLQKSNHLLRNAEHLEWRYGRHPVFSYEFFKIAGKGGEAAVGLRVDQVGNTKIAHVVECLGEERTLPAALAFIDEFCREREICLADFTCTASALSAHFLGAGWFSILDDKDVQVAHLFYPPEFREPPTTSLMLWSREGMADLLDFGRLYFTKGDLDLDRPTHAYYESRGLASA